MLEGDTKVIDRSMMHPVPMKTGDVFIQHYQGGPGYGDPIERKPESVVSDLNNNTVIERKARDVYGVSVSYDEKEKTWKYDRDETERLREEIREKRKKRGIPVEDWIKAERENILKKEFLEVVNSIYRESMALTPEFAVEYRKFWGLPEDFVF